MSKSYWMIRAEGGEIIDLFLSNNIVAIGWQQLGNLSLFKTRDDLICQLEKIYPAHKAGHYRIVAGILSRFVHSIKQGDKVITYEPSKRIYHIGEIASEYIFNPHYDNRWPNVREVNWIREVSRDTLSSQTKFGLGSTLTLFKLSDIIIPDLEAMVKGDLIITSPEEEVEDELKDIQTRSFENIKDKLMKLDWNEMQLLCAGLLRAMGYKTKVSPAGSDRGKDIVASPDGFGLEQPRIVVEVKHRNQSSDSKDIRSFLGGRHKDDKGLYISTGGFTKDAKYEADRASIPLMLLDVDDLVSEVLNHYENLDVETKLLLPLIKIYWPKE